MYNVIFFDLDGTLTESGRGIANSAAYALRELGRPVPPQAVLRKFVGPPLIESFQNFCGMHREEALQAMTIYRVYYNRQGLFENAVYPGIPETLRALRDAGKLLIVATSKPETPTRRILEHFDLARYFSFVAGANDDETRTRKDEVIAYALEHAPLPPEAKILMVGDREYDILGAKKNGLPAAGVLYGYGSREELLRAGAVGLAETPQDILKLV